MYKMFTKLYKIRILHITFSRNQMFWLQKHKQQQNSFDQKYDACRDKCAYMRVWVSNSFKTIQNIAQSSKLTNHTISKHSNLEEKNINFGCIAMKIGTHYAYIDT